MAHRKTLLFHSLNNDPYGDPFYDFNSEDFRGILSFILSSNLATLPTISFDDGFSSSYEAINYALDLGFPVTVFLITSTINCPGFLTSAQIRYLSSAGVIIGSHGHLHQNLSTLTRDQICLDLNTSISILSTIIPRESIQDLSLPYGGLNFMVNQVASSLFLRIHTSVPFCFPFFPHLVPRLSCHSMSSLQLVGSYLTDSLPYTFKLRLFASLLLRTLVSDSTYRCLKSFFVSPSTDIL
jgi:hypothetical protein